MSDRTPLTAEQQAAITTRDVSVALDAGAGCGKTFVLTERFLSHLDPGRSADPPAKLDELIAITFTDAAAREMRDRVRRACLDRLRRAEPEEGDYWLALLRSIDAARVSTIHAFCATLVRAHAVELGVDPLFQVLDGAAAQVLRSEATDAALRARLDGRDPIAMRLAAEFDLPGLKRRVWGLVDDAPRREFAGWIDRGAGAMVDAWREAYSKTYLPMMIARLNESPAIAELRALLPQASLAEPSFAEVVAELSDLLERLGEARTEDLERVKELARAKGVCNKDDWPDKDLFDRYKKACEKTRAAIGKLKPLAPQEQLAKAAQRGIDLSRLTQEVARAYSDAKSATSVLDYDDLLLEAQRLLTAPEFSDAQESLRERVRLLLVDEFQDTDRTQVAIVKSLVGAGLANGRLFFVGDFKQSIYRFRGAEPGVFRELQDETPARGRLPLAMNFRSQPAVLEFVNALFAPVFGAGYTPLRPARPQVIERPAVEFLWTPTTPKASKPATRKAEANAIASRIRTLLDSGAEIVTDKNDAGEEVSRPVRPGDIAILFRALSDVPLYEQALRDEHIEYYLVGGHAFYSQQEVHDVANLLRVVASGVDEIALAGVLRSPFFSLQDETLYWLVETGGSLSAGFAAKGIPRGLSQEQASGLRHARETVAALRRLKGRASVTAILNEAIERTAFDAMLLAEFLGERKLANLGKLIDQARSFDAYRTGDLDGFVRQLSEFVAREPKEALAATRSGEADEVRLMSVHVAKGLEFPVVFVADISRKPRADTDPVAFSPSLGPLVRSDEDDKDALLGIDIHRAEQQAEDRAEDDRLFYVACTRAADHLVLSAAFDPTGNLEGPWLQTVGEHFDLSTGARKQDAVRDPSPLVAVTPPPPPASGETMPKRGADRRRALERAANEGDPPPPPPEVHPVAVSPESLRRFSVSRLTGRLQHGLPRPAGLNLSAALSAEQDEVDPRGLGTLVHAVLERLQFGGENPISSWCRALAPLHLSRRVDAAAELAERLLSRFLDSDRYGAMLAAKRVEREVEFLLRWPPDRQPGEGPYLQGYIDCLIEDADGGLAVLDYKTNRVEASGVQQAAAQYRLQMYVYALAVEQATGRAPTELTIHFLRPGAEVQFAWDDSARRSAQEMVDQAIALVRAESLGGAKPGDQSPRT